MKIIIVLAFLALSNAAPTPQYVIGHAEYGFGATIPDQETIKNISALIVQSAPVSGKSVGIIPDGPEREDIVSHEDDPKSESIIPDGPESEDIVSHEGPRPEGIIPDGPEREDIVSHEGPEEEGILSNKPKKPAQKPSKPHSKPDPKPSKPHSKPDPKPSKPHSKPDPKPSKPHSKPDPKPTKPGHDGHGTHQPTKKPILGHDGHGILHTTTQQPLLGHDDHDYRYSTTKRPPLSQEGIFAEPPHSTSKPDTSLHGGIYCETDESGPKDEGIWRPFAHTIIPPFVDPDLIRGKLPGDIFKDYAKTTKKPAPPV